MMSLESYHLWRGHPKGICPLDSCFLILYINNNQSMEIHIHSVYNTHDLEWSPGLRRTCHHIILKKIGCFFKDVSWVRPYLDRATDPNNGSQMHFAFRNDTVHVRHLLQQTTHSREAKCIGGERRCNIAIPLSSNANAAALGPATAWGCRARRRRWHVAG